MKPILIVVSTFNRRDLTGITLDSIRRNKSSLSDVLVIDDSSTDYGVEWLSRWGFSVLRSVTPVGVGLAAFRRYQEFVNRGYAYLCALDNDVLVSRRFDMEMLRLFCAVNDDKLTVVSGYHSSTQYIYPPRSLEETDYWFATTINGISQFTDHATAVRVLASMEGKWQHPWDANISRVLTRIAVPKLSLIQHLGIHGSGVNGLSKDIAVDFVGDTFHAEAQ
jgi:glycosyltransferase involved in cell wall biosynthesis